LDIGRDNGYPAWLSSVSPASLNKVQTIEQTLVKWTPLEHELQQNP
jgi:hypothetical protein